MGKRPRSLLSDKPFRVWLEKEKNIEPAYLLTLGKHSLIRSYRTEYLKKKRGLM